MKQLLQITTDVSIELNLEFNLEKFAVIDFNESGSAMNLGLQVQEQCIFAEIRTNILVSSSVMRGTT